VVDTVTSEPLARASDTSKIELEVRLGLGLELELGLKLESCVVWPWSRGSKDRRDDVDSDRCKFRFIMRGGGGVWCV
jgi:hypothetical protein